MIPTTQMNAEIDQTFHSLDTWTNAAYPTRKRATSNPTEKFGVLTPNSLAKTTYEEAERHLRRAVNIESDFDFEAFSSALKNLTKAELSELNGKTTAFFQEKRASLTALEEQDETAKNELKELIESLNNSCSRKRHCRLHLTHRQSTCSDSPQIGPRTTKSSRASLSLLDTASSARSTSPAQGRPKAFALQEPGSKQ